MRLYGVEGKRRPLIFCGQQVKGQQIVEMNFRTQSKFAGCGNERPHREKEGDREDGEEEKNSSYFRRMLAGV